MRNLSRISVLRVLLALASMAYVATVCAASPSSDRPSNELVSRGQYLAKAGDCAACHTAPGGRPMGGGLPIASPFGQIFSSNISPSKIYGIGGYSEDQFARAVREGVRADGTHLYPAMPYTSYAGITDDDIKALYAYFMQSVVPVDAPAPVTQLKFPFNQRWLMGGWNLLFGGGKPLTPMGGKSLAWNRGRYLVATLGHCDSCHTPRNLAMGEKTGLDLSGGQVGPWQAPNITADPISGIGNWTHDEIVQYLRTGAVAGKGQAAGGMAEAVQDSLQYLSADDLSAIAIYLKNVPSVSTPKDTQPAFSYAGTGDGYEATLRATNQGIGFGKPGSGYPALSSGAQLYSGNCASCHQVKGEGTSDDAFPSLTHNSVLGRSNADNLVMVILGGVHINTQNDDRLMPGFADELTDEQVATLATFVMKNYGNPKVTVTAEHVAMLRRGGANPAAALLPVAITGAIVAVALLILLAVWRVRKKRARTH